jgi:serine/threonine-protein kinase
MLESLGHYKILDRIGAGGIGEVYRARDTRLGRTVAIKVLGPDLAAAPELRRTAALLTRLSHPNIAALFDVGEDRGATYLVYEFIPGETLKATISGRPLNPRRAIDFGVQIADALAEAHADNVVHRALTPDTILITPKGNAKILDFGLAEWTRATTVASYAPPDQAPGDRAAAASDPRTDIFALGVILFEMLTGKLPAYDGPLPSGVTQAVPQELDAIVAKAAALRPEDRYESAATLAAELRSVASMLDARAGSSAPSVRPAARAPRRVPLIVLVAAGLVVLAVLAWFVVSAG